MYSRYTGYDRGNLILKFCSLQISKAVVPFSLFMIIIPHTIGNFWSEVSSIIPIHIFYERFSICKLFRDGEAPIKWQHAHELEIFF